LFELALTTFRQTEPSNADYLDELKERLTGSRPIPLLQFVGVGLSVFVGFPSWSGFLLGQAAKGLSRDYTKRLDSFSTTDL
jgi:hypothetical protein